MFVVLVVDQVFRIAGDMLTMRAGEQLELLPWTEHERAIRSKEPTRLLGFVAINWMDGRRWIPIWDEDKRPIIRPTTPEAKEYLAAELELYKAAAAKAEHQRRREEARDAVLEAAAEANLEAAGRRVDGYYPGRPVDPSTWDLLRGRRGTVQASAQASGRAA